MHVEEQLPRALRGTQGLRSGSISSKAPTPANSPQVSMLTGMPDERDSFQPINTLDHHFGGVSAVTPKQSSHQIRQADSDDDDSVFIGHYSSQKHGVGDFEQSRKKRRPDLKISTRMAEIEESLGNLDIRRDSEMLSQLSAKLEERKSMQREEEYLSSSLEDRMAKELARLTAVDSHSTSMDDFFHISDEMKNQSSKVQRNRKAEIRPSRLQIAVNRERPRCSSSLPQPVRVKRVLSPHSNALLQQAPKLLPVSLRRGTFPEPSYLLLPPSPKVEMELADCPFKEHDNRDIDDDGEYPAHRVRPRRMSDSPSLYSSSNQHHSGPVKSFRSMFDDFVV